jgi:predicted enzyme related to lactoylglutathione lyase
LQNDLMERAVGIGGIFIRSRDPKALAEWYRNALGIEMFDDEGQGAPWETSGGITAMSAAAHDTDSFGRMDQGFMLNFRVANLDAMLAQLRAAGAEVDDKVETYEGMGSFGWAKDPEGNRFELWEPAAQTDP